MLDNHLLSDWIIIGNGNQGSKHVRHLGSNCRYVIDTKILDEGIRQLRRYSNNGVKNVLIATPESVKLQYITESINLNLNLFVEKPVPLENDLSNLIREFLNNGNIYLTLYDHMFDTNIALFIDRVFKMRLSNSEWFQFFAEYMFGTQELIKRSPWMDFGAGSWELVAPHILKIGARCGLLDFDEMKFSFFFSELQSPSTVVGTSSNRGKSVQLMSSYNSWKNGFRMRIFYSSGFLEVNGLEKWGHSSFEEYKMNFTSNKPELINSNFSNHNPASYVERIHHNLGKIDLMASFEDDIKIWRFLQMARLQLEIIKTSV